MEEARTKFWGLLVWQNPRLRKRVSFSKTEAIIENMTWHSELLLLLVSPNSRDRDSWDMDNKCGRWGPSRLLDSSLEAAEMAPATDVVDTLDDR